MSHSSEVSVGQPPQKEKKSVKKALVAAILAVVIVVAAGAGVVWGLTSGAIAAPGAAGKYNVISYIQESEVNDYVATYKKMMGYEDADDEAWATFLAQNNLTPKRLRQSTIHQLVCDKLIQDKASSLGVTVEDSEVEEVVNSLKESVAFGDDSIWQQTLESYGRTEDQVVETYRQQLLARKVYTQEVPMPTATDDEVKSCISSMTSTMDDPVVKHTYCFTISGKDEEGSNEKYDTVVKAKKTLKKMGVTKENFNTLVQTLSDNDTLVNNGGANGWSIDSGDLSENYQKAIETTSKGELSSVFEDTDGYAFIWVDTTCKLPVGTDAVDEYDLDKLPDSLRSYFNDTAAYMLWENDCNMYLSDLVDSSGLIYFDMPQDVPYNVDMSLANTDDSDDDDSGSDAGSSDSGDGGDGNGSSDGDTASSEGK